MKFKQHGEWAAHSQLPLDDIPAKLPEVHIFDDNKGVFRFGKKRAGRLLDGREWNEYPKLT